MLKPAIMTVPNEPDSSKSKASRSRRILRWTGRIFLVLAVLIGLALFFLPQIANSVLNGLTADLELEQFEVEVTKVGWNEATLTDLVAADEGWSAQADTIIVQYAPWDLLRGKVQQLALENLRFDLAGDKPAQENPTENTHLEDTPPSKAPDQGPATSLAWIHSLPNALAKCPHVAAPNTKLTISHGSAPIQKTFDLALHQDGSGTLHLSLENDEQTVSAELKSATSKSSLTIQLALPELESWLTIAESILGAETPWLPAELLPGPLRGEALLTISDKVDAIELSGAIADLRYALEDKSLKAVSSQTTFEGLIRPDGPSQIELRGDLTTCELQFDSIPGGTLTLSKDARPKWTTILAWGENPFSYSGTLENLELRGGEDNRPLELTQGNATFSNHDALFRTSGALTLNSLPLPFEFLLFPEPTSPNAHLALGPVTLDGPHPLLAVLLPSGEAPDVSGTFEASLALHLASEEPAAGRLIFQVTNASGHFADGFVSLGSLSGSGELQIPRDDSPRPFNFEGSLQTLNLNTRDSLGFPLAHSNAPPATINVHGELSAHAPKVLAKLSGLSLEGQRNEQPVKFASTSLDLEWQGPKLAAKLSSQFGSTPLTIDYAHNYEELPNDAWTLRGDLTLAPTTLVDPLTNAGAFSDLLEGVSIGGKIDSSFQFETGSDRDFEGNLQFGIADGSIELPDQLAAITGLTGRGSVNIPAGDDTPPSWNIAGTLRSLFIDSSDSLGTALNHSGEFIESPAAFAISGTTGDESSTKGEISHLTLSGVNNGEFVSFEESEFQFLDSDTALTVKGHTNIAGNEIPFSYRSTMEHQAGGEPVVTSEILVPLTNLKNPISNLGAFSETAAGMSFSGKIGARLNFRSNTETGGSLELSIADGTLVLPDDGPILNGITVHFATPDLDSFHTAKPESFSIGSLSYGDISFTKLNGRYRIQPDGGIEISKFQSNFLGGRLSLDPFTYPGDDQAKFRMDLRFKGLDLRTLTSLFPSFDGRLEGTIDGHLPVVRKKGTYLPERGGIKLSPSSTARLRYNADSLFTGGLKPGSGEYKRMQLAEDSLKDLRIPVLIGRLFDPEDAGKAAVIRFEGQSSIIPDAPPIHLNFNIFEPEGDFQQLVDYFFKNREKLDFGL